MFFKEFELPTEPKFNDLTVSVLDFGAVADNKTDASEAINDAIKHVSENGGGKVVVPAGTYFSKPITMLSNVNLHMEKGARINFTDDIQDFLPAVFTRIEGIRCYSLRPLIYGSDLENVAITGEGIFNGNGKIWWERDEHKNLNCARASGAASIDLLQMAADGVPVEERVFDTIESGMRPYFLHLMYCKNLLIEGVRFINSPFWCVAPVFSENIIIRNISFMSPKGSHNTDSVDIDSCKNVLVEGVRVDCSSDDGVVIKSGRDKDGLEVDWPTENVVVRNCTFTRSGGTVAIGSETSGGIRNIYIHDIISDNSSSVVNVKTAPGRGNVIENVHIENVKSNKAINAVSITSKAFVKGDFEFKDMPKVRNIYYKNIEVGLCWHGLRVIGFQDYPLENIHLENIKIGCIESTAVIEHVDGMHLNNIEVYLDKENWFDWKTHGHGPVSEE